MGMGFAPTWLRQVSPPPLHETTLTIDHITSCCRLPTPSMPAAYDLNRYNCTVQNITNKWKGKK